MFVSEKRTNLDDRDGGFMIHSQGVIRVIQN